MAALLHDDAAQSPGRLRMLVEPSIGPDKHRVVKRSGPFRQILRSREQPPNDPSGDLDGTIRPDLFQAFEIRLDVGFQEGRGSCHESGDRCAEDLIGQAGPKHG